jgi:hypothetical protein
VCGYHRDIDDNQKLHALALIIGYGKQHFGMTQSARFTPENQIIAFQSSGEHHRS